MKDHKGDFVSFHCVFAYVSVLLSSLHSVINMILYRKYVAQKIYHVHFPFRMQNPYSHGKLSYNYLYYYRFIIVIIIVSFFFVFFSSSIMTAL